jgi:hypothetical protein
VRQKRSRETVIYLFRTFKPAMFYKDHGQQLKNEKARRKYF